MKITEILLEDHFPVEDIPSDVLSLSLRAQISSMIISRQSLTAFSKPYLDVLLPEKNNAASDISISNIEFVRMNQDGSIHIIITATRLIRMIINLDEIRSLSSGRPKNEVIRILEQQYNQNAPDVITIHPGWIQDLPRIPLRIKVEVEELE
jgi:hypothetical protein